MVFVFDLDDTVCNTDGYSEQYINNFIKVNNLPIKQIASVVRFADAKFDWDYETAVKWYKQFGDQMMMEFPCNENAVEVINKLYSMGHKIVIATARATDWHTNPEGATKIWLEKCGINYSSLYVGRVDKEKICEVENADVFLDDDVNIAQRVAENFQKLNKNALTCLFSTAYNKTINTPNNVKRIENFEEFLNVVTKFSTKKY